MLEGSCHCGAVKLEVESAPTQLTSCNCSLCRRLGALWCYYAPAQVRITGETATYRWGDRTLDTHRCTVCGCVTHWSPTDSAGNRMGVNARLLDPLVIADVRVRRLDGAATWEFLD